MIALTPWIERRRIFDLPVGASPAVFERLRTAGAQVSTLSRNRRRSDAIHRDLTTGLHGSRYAVRRAGLLAS